MHLTHDKRACRQRQLIIDLLGQGVNPDTVVPSDKAASWLDEIYAVHLEQNIKNVLSPGQDFRC